MRLDRVQVAVRPRGILECLDLALLVCGRRPLGLLVAAAAGGGGQVRRDRNAMGPARQARAAAPGFAPALAAVRVSQPRIQQGHPLRIEGGHQVSRHHADPRRFRA